jgi:heme-degrading monooxygenase HmoA
VVVQLSASFGGAKMFRSLSTADGFIAAMKRRADQTKLLVHSKFKNRKAVQDYFQRSSEEVDCRVR